MPGRKAPRASAPSIIASAIRSLYEPVGFSDSSLTITSAAAAGMIRFRRTTGVPPIALNTESAVEEMDMERSLSRRHVQQSASPLEHVAKLPNAGGRERRRPVARGGRDP